MLTRTAIKYSFVEPLFAVENKIGAMENTSCSFTCHKIVPKKYCMIVETGKLSNVLSLQQIICEKLET